MISHALWEGSALRGNWEVKEEEISLPSKEPYYSRVWSDFDGLCSREQTSMDNDTLFHKLDGDITNAHFINSP